MTGGRSCGLGVSGHPSADWIARQGDGTPEYLLRDRDKVYGNIFVERVRAMNIRGRPIAARSPWQNGYCERAIGSIRRDCLDHVIVFWRATSSPSSAMLRDLLDLLQSEPNTPVIEQGCTSEATRPRRRVHRREANPRRTTPSLCTNLISDRLNCVNGKVTSAIE